jgi:quercetin dioxygenase-like cupin family protein
MALGVGIADFVEEESHHQVVYLKRDQRPRARSLNAWIESLGSGLAGQIIEPLLITLEPEADSGPEPIMHPGHELVFCLEGAVVYEVDGQAYRLGPEDSLLFEARLAHRWRNDQAAPTRLLLLLQGAAANGPSAPTHF